MTILTLSTALAAVAGLVLGLRFKMLVLVPATTLALVASASVGLVQGTDLVATAQSTFFAVVALQLGYLGGAAARLSRAERRAPQSGLPDQAPERIVS